MSVSIALATRDDDAGIRHLLATNAMPGAIRLTFEREPDYFAGCAATAPFTQVLVAKDGARVVGLACRAIRPMFVNGRIEPVGYLGQLRVDPDYRGRWLVARGFGMLRELHADGRARGYVTTIIDGNREAAGVLVGRARRAMPRYRFVERLVTVAIPTAQADDGGIDRGSDAELDAITSFLHREGSRRNFFPLFDVRTLPGLHARDFVIVRRDGAIAGVAGLWDQNAFKQTVVAGYDALLSVARPLVNAAAAMLRQPALPRPGSALRMAFGSFFCVAGDDVRTARSVIAQLLLAAREQGLQQVVIGFAERDPLLAAARAFRRREYGSSIYSVAWDNGDFHDRLDHRYPYLEVATL